MKVLTIKQPYASAVVYGYMEFEFRSWKTNYRGEIYIHAAKAKSKASNASIASTYLKSRENPEHIICKCLLKNCIYMDEDFINEVKKNKEEYNSGHYEVGRYAWQLEVIEVLEEPIYAKGQLGIWNF